MIMSINVDSTKASSVIRNKLIEVGGTATVYTLRGIAFNITISSCGNAFVTKKLPQVKYGFDVFDVIIDLLNENNGKAFKGCGRGKNNKLGELGCELDTVVGAIAYRYAGKKVGDSVFDPVFVLAAILDWAEICFNERGALVLKKNI